VLALYRKLPGWRGRRRADSTTDYFARYGAATIPLGRFFTSVRAFAWPVAAARGIGYAKFFALDVPSALLWAALWILLGASVGSGWRAAAETAGAWLAIGGVVVLAGAAALVAMHLRRRRASH
jgi:membrane protein DedA with SNARE-associated domain